MADAVPEFAMLPIPAQAIDRALVQAYALLTDDFNPIHLDDEFAARTEFGRAIAHGTSIVAPLWDHLAGSLPPDCDVRFVRPTPVGASITYWEQRGVLPGRNFEVRTEGGEVVVSIRCREAVP